MKKEELRARTVKVGLSDLDRSIANSDAHRQVRFPALDRSKANPDAGTATGTHKLNELCQFGQEYSQLRRMRD